MKLPIVEIITGVLTLGFAGGLINAMIEDGKKEEEKRAEEERRKSTPCNFDEGVSKKEFENMANQIRKRIKRLIRISVDGPIVRGTVRSQSGISKWSFAVDFNDYGHISGKYWLSSENEDSDIPKQFAEIMSKAIMSGNFEKYQNDFAEGPIYCPYCGTKQIINNAQYCSFCGEKIK